jgi:hypothetical protein
MICTDEAYKAVVKMTECGASRARMACSDRLDRFLNLEVVLFGACSAARNFPESRTASEP